VSNLPDEVWRVGYVADPLGFVPHERSAFSHRFDDPDKHFRSLYAAQRPETCLREVLADVRPNAAALQAFVDRFSDEDGDPADELPSFAVTAAWRRKNVLAAARIRIDHGDVLDLTDPEQRRDVEMRHADLLAEHGLDHLDLHEITTRRRVVTQTIAADAYTAGVAVICFPSSRDGQRCFALLEGRAHLEPLGDPIPLVDPAPSQLLQVCAEWNLPLEPTD